MSKPRNAIERFAQIDGRDWLSLRVPNHAELLAQVTPCIGCGVSVFNEVFCSKCRKVRHD